MKNSAHLVKGKLAGISKEDRMLAYLPNGDENKWPDSKPLASGTPFPDAEAVGEMFWFKIVDGKVVEITPA